MVWWLGIDQEIESITKKCRECLLHSDYPPKSVLYQWPCLEGPSQILLIDFLGLLKGSMFIIIIDAYSKWIFVKRMTLKDITSSSTIKVLKEYFPCRGIQAKIVSGPSLCSNELDILEKKWSLSH